MNISVVIPAKGSSDRLREKNLIKVLDYSLTEMACEKFLKSKVIDNVYLDTDSEKIIDDVLHLFSEGLKLIRRPEELKKILNKSMISLGNFSMINCIRKMKKMKSVSAIPIIDSNKNCIAIYNGSTQ